MPLTPFEGTYAAPLKRFTVRGVGATAAVSPNTITFQLPEQGIYLATFNVYKSNQNNRAIATAIVMWYSFNGTNYALGCDALATHFENDASALTFTAPTTGGLITGTLTWGSGGTNSPTGAVDLRQLMGAQDLYNV